MHRSTLYRLKEFWWNHGNKLKTLRSFAYHALAFLMLIGIIIDLGFRVAVHLAAFRAICNQISATPGWGI